MLLNAADSCLLIVDVQERLLPVMADPRQVLKSCSLLIRAAQRLDIPVIVSEQYPKGLGPTMIDLRELVPPEAISKKMHFSCAADSQIEKRLADLGRKQVAVAGIEAHVCVLQTALGLKSKGYETFCVMDGCSSRRPESAQAAFQRMRGNGVETVIAESVVFEWLGCAGTADFKNLQPLLKGF